MMPTRNISKPRKKNRQTKPNQKLKIDITYE